MATIRALWNSKGKLVNRDSPYFPLRNAIFDLPPYRGKWPEIWIGAHAPHRGALRGCLLPELSAPASGLQATSRRRSIGRFRRRSRSDVHHPDEFFARHSVRHPLGAGFSGGQDLLPHDMDEQTALSHAAAVSTSILREMLLNGTPDEVIEQAAQWRDNGVRYFVLISASVMQRSLRKSVASIMPFNKVIRGIKKL